MFEQNYDNNNNFIKRSYNTVKNFFKGNEQISIQKQVDLQKLVQLQDQDNRNFTLGGILSCLETIAFKISPSPNTPKKYDGYNPKSVQERKSLEQLVTQLRIQSKAFKNMYDECVDTHDNYWFPDNLSKEDIIEDIKKWKKLVTPQYKAYYDNIIYIFTEEEDKIYYPPIKNIKNEKRASCDPEKQLKLIPPNIGYINYRRKLVKRDFLKGKQFDNTIKLYQEKHCDSAFEKMNERYKKALEKHGDFCDCEICICSVKFYN